jgi:hypothetical protein
MLIISYLIPATRTSGRRMDLFEVLMQRGPELEATDHDGCRVLHHAAGTYGAEEEA